jgi:hypothetical protein
MKLATAMPAVPASAEPALPYFTPAPAAKPAVVQPAASALDLMYGYYDAA